MNNALILGLICFVAGLVGAALGAALLGRSARQRAEARWPARLQEAIAPALQTQLTQLMARVGQLPLAGLDVASAGPSTAPPTLDLATLSNQLAARLEAQFTVANRQADARNSALGAALTEAVTKAWSATAAKAKGDGADHAVQQALQGLPATVQRALQEAVGPLTQQAERSAQAHTQEVAQLRQSLERWQAKALAAAAPSEAVAVPAGPGAASSLDLAPVVRQIATALEAQFDASFEAQNLVQAAAQQKAELSLHQALQRVPQVLQQAIQVELEFQATQQAQRDQAQTQQQERWQAEVAHRAAQRDQQSNAQHEAQRAAELRVLLQALSVQPGQAPGRAALAAPAPPQPDQRPSVPAPGSAPAPAAPVSARPPELLLTPIARPEPVYAPEESERELSDAELDALPPELPAAGLPRKRLLPAPTKPPPLRPV